MTKLTWIDPATGEPHRNDHICNQACRDLREKAREAKVEPMDIKDALKGLKQRDRLIMESRESVIVYKDELDTLIAYVEEKEGIAKKGFRIGDKVALTDEAYAEASSRYGVEKQGVIGTVWKPEEKDWDYGVVFSNATDGSWELDFNADELRKVENNESKS